MRLINLALIILFSMVVSAQAATITTITVKEMDGVSTSSYPLTFGHVFQQGDVSENVYLNNYPTQTDVKTTWPDGSIRQAVISAIVPITANTDLVLNINDTGTAAGTTPITKAPMLETDIGATIDLTNLSGSGYSGSLQADLRAAITAASSFDYWLEGDVVSEILIQQSLNSSLDASWEVRFYPSTSYIRISHSVENMRVSTMGNVNYALEIKQGNSAPASVYRRSLDYRAQHVTTPVVRESANTAFVVMPAHGFSKDDVVTIAGVTGADAAIYNGTHTISKISTMGFYYITASDPSEVATTGDITVTESGATTALVGTVRASSKRIYMSMPAHNYETNDVVVVSGVTGANAAIYNGTFLVEEALDNGFYYKTGVDPSSTYPSGTPVTTSEVFQHNNSSRWRKVFWLGTGPPDVEIHYNIDYMISTNMIMPYDTDIAPTEADIADFYDAEWSATNTDIMGNGALHLNMGDVGGRPEIGILPYWDAMYLLTMDNRMKEMVLGHSDLSGSIPIHIEEDNSAYSFYGKTINIDDYDYSTTGGDVSLPTALGDLSTLWITDRAHQTAFGYLPYLITGERFYLDEMYYWAGKNLAWDTYGRDGDGNAQDFSAQIGDGTAANGIMYNQMRGTVWALRNIHNAAICSPRSSDEYSYFLSKVENNVKWLFLGNTGSNAHGLHALRIPRQDSGNDGALFDVASYQHDFATVVLADIQRKNTISNMAELTTLINNVGQFTIGRFTHDPAFPKFEGAGYWWPLVTAEHGYYSNGSWADYWQDILDHPISDVDPNNIKTDFTRDYADGYPAIARAALSQLTHLTDGQTAYDFVMDNINYETWSPADPTWAILPSDISVDNPTTNKQPWSFSGAQFSSD